MSDIKNVIKQFKMFAEDCKRYRPLYEYLALKIAEY